MRALCRRLVALLLAAGLGAPAGTQELSFKPPAGSSRKELSIERVVRNVKSLAGTVVRVRGQFRGRNLFSEDGCLGAPSDGWVLRDGPFWLWVTGKKPQGQGWSLDPHRLDDTLRWSEVVGKPEPRDECIVLKAQEIALASGPESGRLRDELRQVGERIRVVREP